MKTELVGIVTLPRAKMLGCRQHLFRKMVCSEFESCISHEQNQ